jgi:lactoylglutathione lyase
MADRYVWTTIVVERHVLRRSFRRVFALSLLFACSASAGQRERPVPASTASTAASDSGVLGTDHVGLTVTDLEASKALFVGVLDFRVRGRDADYPAYFLTNGSTTVTLWRAEDPESATPFDRRKNVGLHHLALAVDTFESLERLHERLAAHPRVTIEFAPELAYGGPAKHMMFYEPSGNRIELVHRPSP